MRSHHVLGLAVLGLFVVTARADLTVEIGNGDKVNGSIGPSETETYLIDVPDGSKLSVSAKGKKAGKGTKAPVVSVEIRDSEGALVVSSTKSKAAKAKVTVTKTDTYSVSVTSTETGNYQFKAKWKAPKKTKMDLPLGDAPDELKITFDADAGALATMKVKPVKGSAADPRFDRIDNDGGSANLPDPEPEKKGHTLKKYEIDTFGFQCLFAANDAKATVTVKAPKSAKRKIDLTDEVIGPGSGDDEGIGAIVTPGDGGMVVAGPEQGSIDGAAVDVPPGAVTQNTVVGVATAPELVPPAGEGLGPTVFFGPEGLEFGEPVTVQLPFDPAALDGDFTDLEIYTRDENGNISLVPGPYNLDDAGGGVISVQVSGFSSYLVSGPILIGSPSDDEGTDLNDDGTDDLVIPAPFANQGAGAVFIFFGPVGDGQTTQQANVEIPGDNGGDEFGESLLVKDVNGDGIVDLIVGSNGSDAGAVHLFFGGSGFSPSAVEDADVTIDGETDGDDFGGTTEVGDLTGDGRPDLIVGAEGAGGTGKVYVFVGTSPSAFPSSATTADAVITGGLSGGLFGAGLAVGDVDNGGEDDLIIGADQIDSTGGTGAVYVFFNDYYGVYDQSASNADVRIDGTVALGGFGLDVRSGDVTGDEVDDIVTTDGSDSPLPNQSGAIFIFEGGTGLSSGDADEEAFRRFTGFGSDDRLGTGLQLVELGPGPLKSIVTTAPNHAGGAGGLYLFLGGAGMPPSGQLPVNASQVIGESTGEPLRVVLQPFRVGLFHSIVTAAPDFGQNLEGRVYVFNAPTVDPGGSASAADVKITGQAGDAIGGEIEQ